MEQIKDMVTLRAFALEQTIRISKGDYFDCNILDRAKRFEAYVLGEAELPEVYDTDKQFNELRDIFKENIPKPMDQMKFWMSAEIKPQNDVKVLISIKGSDNVYFGSYDGTQWMVEIDNGLVAEVDGDFMVVAWLPIPEYNGKVL